jgi:pilus assembly protein CpaF
MTVEQFQKEIFDEINNPNNKIHLKIQKKQIERVPYLEEVKKRAKSQGLSEEEMNDVCYLVEKSLWGFGCLEDLIEDETISDIRLINENEIRIKRLGKREESDITFDSKEEYEKYIEFITNRNATNISIVNAAQVFTDNDTCPTDILRFSLVSQLVNTNERPTLLIRKIPKKKKTFENLILAGYLTDEQTLYIQDRWEHGHGFLVCGPNGSGKTTLINAILDYTPKTKSCVVIQESEELFCEGHPEMIFRKVIPPKNGTSISYSLKDLSRLALMESFDIMVIGEIKGDEAADLSYASYTGSQVMTSVHSNSAEEGYEKVIDYGLDAQPNRSRDHFAKQIQSLDTVVFVKDYKIAQILESDGWDKKHKEFLLHEVDFNK